ncbi:MAG: sodium:solute symporter [Hyphomicrobium zavarzinii]|uniref:solute symporter family protein n=1 Tax=Hyphomicrobium zavarzinii TaxID=48292 RepID=UPI001A5C791C|nr:sodium:solute symporter [Hyphomicrobium zavarzinii]MBL8847170.1 sodium:solute symporter [Hyphomicrobium zavarzinii]
MPFSHRTGYVNPRLGTYFGIFMSAFVALTLLVLILEGLGVSDSTLRLAMFLGPIAFYAIIGLAAYSSEPIDYFAAGRRVPAFYTGLVLAQTALGATGLVALTGAFFLIGFDALCIVIGGLAGFVVMAVLLAPFFRKFGAFTVPSYLGKRFESRALRLVAGGILAVPMLLVMAAELRIGAHAAVWFYPMPSGLAVMLLVTVIVLTLAAGGMRSFAWSSSAQSIAALIALLVPIAIVGVIVTNLPLPQLSSGPVLRMMGRAEAAQGLPIILPPALAFDMPGEGLAPIAKRYSDAFGSVGPLAFVIIILTLLSGIASAPWLLPRVAGTPGVYEARKSLGWATFLFGIAMLTIASVAIFMRDYLTDLVTAVGQVRFPEWFDALRERGILSVAGDGRPTLSSFNVSRDDVLLSLPIAAEMPAALVYLAAGGVVAAALATAGAVALALGNILAEDIVYGLSWSPARTGPRLIVSRLALGTAAAVAGLIALAAPTDPLKLVLWAVALTGASTFPVLVLSIWWKRLNAFGAVAGMATGFGVTVLAIIAGEAGLTGTDSALAAAIGLPAGAVATIAVALATPGPQKTLLELVRDIRVPGGEILYDREMRHQRRKKAQRT